MQTDDKQTNLSQNQDIKDKKTIWNNQSAQLINNKNTDDETQDYNIKILNHEWDEEWFFSVTENDIDRFSILELAENNWLNIWYSCRSWACVSCQCTIVQWQENIDIGKMEIPLIDVPEWDVLTCCAWLTSINSQIIIKKRY